jgi:hypothetical protein
MQDFRSERRSALKTALLAIACFPAVWAAEERTPAVARNRIVRVVTISQDQLGKNDANLIEATVAPASHRTVGASTAVFTALGLMAAHSWRIRLPLRRSARRLAWPSSKT